MTSPLTARLAWSPVRWGAIAALLVAGAIVAAPVGAPPVPASAAATGLPGITASVPCSGAFTTVGTFDCVVPTGVNSIDVLVVGGGGGGGAGFDGGGGGGGGEVKVCTLTVTAGSTLSGEVAAGGLGSTGVFDAAQDGTAGGSSFLSTCSAAGGAGGSGNSLGFGRGGASGNANAGGIASPDFDSYPLNGGGGGGAGAAGGAGSGSNDKPPCLAGVGGAGVKPSDLTSPGLFSTVTTLYGGGGGGGNGCSGPGGNGGSGGGGKGGAARDGFVNGQDNYVASAAGTANTGGGGGGGANEYNTGQGPGAAGGSGYVEIRVPVTPPKTTPTLTYTGPSTVPSGSPINPSASLSPSECTGAITYKIDDVVVSPSATYPDGTYEIEAIYAGSSTCEAVTILAIVTVGGTASASSGGGWYNVSGAGRVNFGYTVQVNRSRNGSTQVSGQMVWNSQNGRFRFKGVITSFVKTDCSSSVCGRIVGAGTLRTRNDAGEWVVVGTGLEYKASVIDAGTASVCTGGRKQTCTTVNRPDSFGLDVAGSTFTGEQSLGSSGWPTPVQLSGGNVLIK